MSVIQTASGPITAADLGMTLMHEHIFVNLLKESRPGGLLNDFPLMQDEVKAFASTGGKTIVDLTTAEVSVGAAPDPTGRFGIRGEERHHNEPSDGSSRSVENVLSLARMSEASGINIVLGTGHYRDPYLDTAWFDQHGVEQIAEYMVADIQDGISGTGVRAGIIGEIGSDKWFTSSLEERSFRAAGRAHSATGVAVTTHAAKWPVGLEQIAILKDEGVDPARIIVGHCDTVNIPEYHVALATAGVFVQFDNIRRSTPYDLDCRVRFVVSLVRKGFLDQILLSHDVCKRAHLNISGGGGFDFVPTDFSAALRSAGLGAEEINHMLVDNPRRALTGER